MLRSALVLMFFLCAASLFVHADIDPRIVIAEPACQSGDTDVFNLVNGFAAIPINGGGTFHFCNKTGVDWTNVLVTINTTAPASSIECPSYDPLNDPLNNNHLAFAFCFVTQAGTNLVNALFTGTFPPIGPPINFQGFPGVPNLERFTLDLDCHDFQGCTPWPEGTTMTGSANTVIPPVPEPATMLLLGSGLVTGYFRRKGRA